MWSMLIFPCYAHKFDFPTILAIWSLSSMFINLASAIIFTQWSLLVVFTNWTPTTIFTMWSSLIVLTNLTHATKKASWFYLVVLTNLTSATALTIWSFSSMSHFVGCLDFLKLSKHFTQHFVNCPLRKLNKEISKSFLHCVHCFFSIFISSCNH